MSWDGIPEHRNLQGGGEQPRPPFGRWRDFFGDMPAPVPVGEAPADAPQMPADPFTGMAAPSVAAVELFRSHVEAGMTEQQALFYLACINAVWLAIQRGGLLDRWPQEPET